MQESIDKPRSHRRRVAAVLALLSSSPLQEKLGRRTDPESAAYELCSIWFDDVYVPSERYLRGLKGDFSPEHAEQFREAFSEEELAAMERFHRFLELRIEMVSPESLRRERIPIDDRWTGIMKDAAYLLEDLGFDVEAIRRDLVDRIDAAQDVSTALRVERSDDDRD